MKSFKEFEKEIIGELPWYTRFKYRALKPLYRFYWRFFERLK